MRLVFEKEITTEEPVEDKEELLWSVFNLVSSRAQKDDDSEILLYILVGSNTILEFKPKYRIVDRNWNLILPYFRRYLVVAQKYYKVEGYVLVWKQNSQLKHEGNKTTYHFSLNVKDSRKEYLAIEDQVAHLKMLRQIKKSSVS